MARVTLNEQADDLRQRALTMLTSHGGPEYAPSPDSVLQLVVELAEIVVILTAPKVSTLPIEGA